MKGKVHGQTIRDRARAVREVGSVLSQQFRTAQIGRIRPGLTLRQRARTVVLTDNYLRVQVPVPPPENVRVHVRILTATDSPAGELVNESMTSTP